MPHPMYQDLQDLCDQPHLDCTYCGEPVSLQRVAIKGQVCLYCGEEHSRAERKSWCVLTPHKQGPMFFTPSFAREAAVGINNKGGLVTEGV
jgi:hypothetical protein